MPSFRTTRWFSTICFACLLTGCGQTATESTQQGQAATNPSSKQLAAVPFVPPPASITSPETSRADSRLSDVGVMQTGGEMPNVVEDDFLEPAADTSPVEIASFEPGSPEWLMREIAMMHTQAVTATPTNDELRKRFTKTIDYAMQAIGKLQKDPSKQQLFNNAVHYLSDARLQLALLGDDNQAQLMAEDAAALYQRDATSFAAIESAHKLVQLAEQQALRNAKHDPEWAVRFARQARLFAEQFPQESGRVAVGLISAGTFCDSFGLTDQAMGCLQLVEEKLPGTPYAEQVAGTLRRLRLPGNHLEEFGGSTLDGGYVSIEQFRGKYVVIVFWASNSEFFKRDLGTIQQATKDRDDVVVLGVNMDRDEFAVDTFLEQTGLTWRHIFYSAPDQRGINNLVAQYYGVTKIPSYWVVTPGGQVVSVNAQASELEKLLGL